MFLKVTKGAIGPKPATYDEDVRRVSSVDYLGLWGKGCSEIFTLVLWH